MSLQTELSSLKLQLIVENLLTIFQRWCIICPVYVIYAVMYRISLFSFAN